MQDSLDHCYKSLFLINTTRNEFIDGKRWQIGGTVSAHKIIKNWYKDKWTQIVNSSKDELININLHSEDKSKNHTKGTKGRRVKIEKQQTNGGYSDSDRNNDSNSDGDYEPLNKFTTTSITPSTVPTTPHTYHTNSMATPYTLRSKSKTTPIATMKSSINATIKLIVTNEGNQLTINLNDDTVVNTVNIINKNGAIHQFHQSSAIQSQHNEIIEQKQDEILKSTNEILKKLKYSVDKTIIKNKDKNKNSNKKTNNNRNNNKTAILLSQKPTHTLTSQRYKTRHITHIANVINNDMRNDKQSKAILVNKILNTDKDIINFVMDMIYYFLMASLLILWLILMMQRMLIYCLVA